MAEAGLPIPTAILARKYAWSWELAMRWQSQKLLQ
jgi:hypothetical protein